MLTLMLTDLYFDSIEFRRRLGENAYGEQMFADAVEVKAHVEPSCQLVIDNKGEQAVASLLVFCDCETKVSVGDLANYQDKDYRVLRVGFFSLEGKPHHLEVVLGELQVAMET